MKRCIHVVLAFVILSSLSLAAAPVAAATGIFVKVTGIDGESAHPRYKGLIDATGFGFRVSQPASSSVSSGGARTAERANFADIMIEKKLDKSSPGLFLASASGRHVPEVRIFFVRNPDLPYFLEYTLTDVIISSVTRETEQKTGDIIERVTFNYGRITQNYTKQKNPDGSGGGNVRAGWDLMANRPL